MPLDNNTYIAEYELILMGRSKKKLSRYVDKKSYTSTKTEQEIVGCIWRYAVTELLNWTPQQAVMYMNDEIATLLCLDKTLPLIGVTRRKEFHLPDYRFVLQYAFPDDVHYGDDDWSLEIFKRCANIGEFQHAPKYEYPKNYWDEAVGYDRAIMAFAHILNNYYSDISIHELYDYFADQKQAMRAIKKYALGDPLKRHFESPLEYLHETLYESGLEDETYYCEVSHDQSHKCAADAHQIGERLPSSERARLPL